MNPSNPLSLINKAFLVARWKQDIETSISLLKKAIELDPMCELAYAHLGQLYIQTSQLELAIGAYTKGLWHRFETFLNGLKRLLFLQRSRHRERRTRSLSGAPVSRQPRRSLRCWRSIPRSRRPRWQPPQACNKGHRPYFGVACVLCAHFTCFSVSSKPKGTFYLYFLEEGEGSSLPEN